MAKTKSKVDVGAVRSAFHGGELELVGTWEAAEIIGVERPRIGRWLGKWRVWAHGDEEWRDSGGASGTPPHVGPEPETKIPKPLADVKSGPVWLRADIEEFATARNALREQAVA